MAESDCKTLHEVAAETGHLVSIAENSDVRRADEFVAGIESACDTVLIQPRARLPERDGGMSRLISMVPGRQSSDRTFGSSDRAEVGDANRSNAISAARITDGPPSNLPNPEACLAWAGSGRVNIRGGGGSANHPEVTPKSPAEKALSCNPEPREIEKVVRRRRLELPRGCPRQPLKLVRLPFPPPPHAGAEHNQSDTSRPEVLARFPGNLTRFGTWPGAQGLCAASVAGAAVGTAAGAP